MSQFEGLETGWWVGSEGVEDACEDMHRSENVTWEQNKNVITKYNKLKGNMSFTQLC